jgi:hypothetical protein
LDFEDLALDDEPSVEHALYYWDESAPNFADSLLEASKPREFVPRGDVKETSHLRQPQTIDAQKDLAIVRPIHHGGDGHTPVQLPRTGALYHFDFQLLLGSAWFTG